MATTCNLTFISCTSRSLSAESNIRRFQLTTSFGHQFCKISALGSLQLSEWTGKIPSCTRGRRNARRFSVSSAMDVPDFLPATWSKEGQATRPIGPSFDLTAEDAIHRQLDALQINDQPYLDHGVEVMYRFAGFDPFQRSTYFGPTFDLGQFERFRRIFHHSTYRVLLSHKERRILSSLFLDEHCFKLRVWINGARPGEEEIFEFTLVQRVGGNWDGYWLTDSLHHDGHGITGGIAY